MYTSPDDARSDLFLAGAVYLFGPLILGILLRIVPLTALPGVGIAFVIVQPLLTTVLVPYLLIRYRREPLALYGLGGRAGSVAVLGALAALPIVAASALQLVLVARTGGEVASLGLVQGPLGIVAGLVRWLGLAGLAVYATVKARDAFRGDPEYVRKAVRDVGRVLALVGAGTVALLFVALLFRGGEPLDAVELVLVPLGAAAGVAVAYRGLGGPSITTRATLLTPAVLLALGPFALSLDAGLFLNSLRIAVIFAAVGLVIGALQEARRSAYGALALAVVLGLLTQL
jgi:hypothetical protein